MLMQGLRPGSKLSPGGDDERKRFFSPLKEPHRQTIEFSEGRGLWKEENYWSLPSKKRSMAQAPRKQLLFLVSQRPPRDQCPSLTTFQQCPSRGEKWGQSSLNELFVQLNALNAKDTSFVLRLQYSCGEKMYLSFMTWESCESTVAVTVDINKSQKGFLKFPFPVKLQGPRATGGMRNC